MALQLTYWEKSPSKDPEAYDELRHVLLKSIDEAFPLALAHNRPNGCSLIALERHRNYKGRRWIDEKIVWRVEWEYPKDPTVRPEKTIGGRKRHGNR